MNKQEKTDQDKVEEECLWYVLHTTAGREEKQTELLGRFAGECHDFQCWFPTYTERRKYGDKYIDVRMPLFKGYVFIVTGDVDKMFLAFRDRGVYLNIVGNKRHLGTGDSYEFVPVTQAEKQFMKKLMEMDEDNTERNVAISTGRMVDGRLRIYEGPLKGLEKYIIKLDRHKMKATLSMELFGRRQQFTMGLVVM